MNTSLDKNVGPLFPPTVKFVGQIAFAVGVLIAFFLPLVGLFFLLAGAYVGFGVSGVKLFPSESMYQDYSGVFGLRFGKKHSYQSYPFLTVLRTKVTSSAYSMTNRNASTGTDLYYDVCLLSTSHRERILIRRYTNQHDAKQNANELKTILSKELVMYNPKVSAETRRKR